MALDTNDWQELYEGAREAFGPTTAAIFMKAMESGMRDDLATKEDLANLRAEFGDLRAEFGDLRAEFGMLRGEFGMLRGEFGMLRGEFGTLRGDLEGKLRTQTWAIVAAFVGIGAFTVTLSHLG